MFSGYGSLQCHWFIHVPPGHKILLYFDDFEVEGNPAGRLTLVCLKHYVATEALMEATRKLIVHCNSVNSNAQFVHGDYDCGSDAFLHYLLASASQQRCSAALMMEEP